MNQLKKRKSILMYFQVLALGLILVFSPCSVRNSIQDSIGFTQTGVTNKSKTTNNFEELCLTMNEDISGDHPSEIINIIPEFPAFETLRVYKAQKKLTTNQDSSLSQYEAPYIVKDKTPLYLLHQQFKVYLQIA